VSFGTQLGYGRGIAESTLGRKINIAKRLMFLTALTLKTIMFLNLPSIKQ